MINTYEEAIHLIHQIPKYGLHPGRENAAHLLKLLGHPERSMKIIHVAGTNGKGSVCAFLADMLTSCGYRTGLFVSPHLVDIRERIQLDRCIISKESFLKAFLAVEQAVEQLFESGYAGITYFDYLFAIGMCYFAQARAEYLVMETGLGGLYDSTNAVENPIFTIITSLSLDHTEVLGDTLEEIALQKAGIIKPGVPLIYCADEPAADKIITERADEQHAPCLAIKRCFCQFTAMEQGKIRFRFALPSSKHPILLTVNSAALYQMENAAIAFSAALLLMQPDSAPADAKTALALTPTMLSGAWASRLKQALEGSCWEGRMELVAPEVYVDGAHNADGIQMLLASLRVLAKTRPATLLFTAVKEKDTDRMIKALCESGLFHRYILTTLDSPRAIPADVLGLQFMQHTDLPVKVYPSPKLAFQHGLSIKQEGEIFLVAGSLYLVGIIKEIIRNHNN